MRYGITVLNIQYLTKKGRCLGNLAGYMAKIPDNHCRYQASQKGSHLKHHTETQLTIRKALIGDSGVENRVQMETYSKCLRI